MDHAERLRRFNTGALNEDERQRHQHIASGRAELDYTSAEMEARHQNMPLPGVAADGTALRTHEEEDEPDDTRATTGRPAQHPSAPHVATD